MSTPVILLLIPFAIVVGIAVNGFLTLVAAALAGIEDLSFRKACALYVPELILVGGAGALFFFVLTPEAFAGGSRGSTGGQWTTPALVLGSLVLVSLVVAVLTYCLFIPVRLGRAVRMWVMRLAVSLVLYGLVTGLVLVGMAIYQVWPS
jgi:hypothetical protein